MLGGHIITNFDDRVATLPSSVQTLDLSYNSISAFTPTNLPQGLTDLYINNNFYPIQYLLAYKFCTIML